MNGQTLSQATENSNVAFHASWMRDFRKALAKIEPTALKTLHTYEVESYYRDGYTAKTAADMYAGGTLHRNDLWD